MMRKLSKRERLMAATVIGALPIALVMFLVVYVGGGLADRAEQIQSLEQEQQQLNLRMARGHRAIRRGNVYREESPPSNSVQSLNAYQSWLAELSQEAFGDANFTVAKGYNQSVKYNLDETIFVKQGFTLTGTGTLRQMTEFLYRFYQTRVLHRLSGMTLTPEVAGQGARARTTGRLRITLNIEVAVLSSAKPEGEFTGAPRGEMLRSLDEYHNVVTRRNLFGPPNQPPVFSTSNSHDFETGKDIRVALEANDEQATPLTFELIETSTPNAEVSPTGDGSASFTVPPLAKGTHRFVVRVTDNGWPNKSQDLALQIRVDDPAPEIVETPEPLPQYARYAVISGITTNVAGERQVWIKLRQPDDKLHRLVIGETFELDDLTWTVREITDDQVVIEVDGDSRTYRVRSTLSDPVSATTSTAASR